MNILIAVHGFPPSHYAGAERVAERIAHWLAARAHTVAVFAVEQLDDPHFRVEIERENGFPVHRVFYNAGTTAPYPGSYDSPQLADAIQQVLKQSHFDLIHIISGYLLAVPVIRAARQAGIPVAITLTEYWFLCARLNLLRADNTLCSGPETDRKCARCLAESKRRYRLFSQKAPGLVDALWQIPVLHDLETAVGVRRVTLHRTLQEADLVISPSQFLIDKFAEFGFDTERFALVRHGLAATNKSPAPADRGPADALHLGYLGQIKPHKGVDLIVDAVLPLLDAGHAITLDLWGPDDEDPAYTAALKRRTANYPAVRWQGSYQKNALWDILASLAVLVVPSRWYENSPSVIWEAYAAGVPVIATRLGGMAELIKHEQSGLLFELNDAQDLRRQLERLVSEPELLPRLRAGIPPVRTDHDEVSEIFALYQRLLRSPA
ncbi:MAG: glycosyl transferase family 1 [Chloroflexota bacterium]|nr:MAG: glycosyl transferase family 1 [Chloroflexota bacterium]